MGKEQIGILGSETTNENQAVISPHSNIQRHNSGNVTPWL